MRHHPTGNAVIDGGHTVLAQLLNELEQRIRAMVAEGSAGQPHTLAPDILGTGRLRAALAGHFHAEEAVLVASGYPGWEAHASRHRDLTEHFETLLAGIETETTALALGVVADLEALLWEHELVEDSDYWSVVSTPPTFTAWSADWLIGHPQVDAHHQALHTLAGLILEATQHRPTFDSRLAMFMRLAAHHLETETVLLRDLGCPEADRHAHLHDELHAALQVIRDYDPAGDHDIIAAFLLYWLKGHIIGHDQPAFAALPRP